MVLVGCVNVKAPERISVNDRPRRVDSSHVPPTRSHEEARQLLAEAYERNRYLEEKVARLERENDELEEERDAYRRRSDRDDD
jgi:hypothetical protein